MDNNIPYVGHKWEVYLSAGGSIASFITAFVTKSNVAWFLGACAAVMAIYSGYLTQKEKKLSIRKLEKDLGIHRKK